MLLCVRPWSYEKSTAKAAIAAAAQKCSSLYATPNAYTPTAALSPTHATMSVATAPRMRGRSKVMCGSREIVARLRHRRASAARLRLMRRRLIEEKMAQMARYMAPPTHARPPARVHRPRRRKHGVARARRYASRKCGKEHVNWLVTCRRVRIRLPEDRDEGHTICAVFESGSCHSYERRLSSHPYPAVRHQWNAYVRIWPVPRASLCATSPVPRT